jgi:signal transduction histidine kinase
MLRLHGLKERQLHDGKRRFTALEARLDDLLDEQVQPRVEAYRSRTAIRARGASRRAATWAMAGLLLAFVIGGAAAAATLRAVSRPLALLSAAAARIGTGDLSQPVGRLPTAEFDRLAVSFDRMAAELASTRSQLEQARDAAEAASRRKSEFVSEVSHELRTPLTAIRAALGLLSATASTGLPPAADRMLELAKRNSERLGHLIDDTLDLDRIEAGADELDPLPLAAAALVDAALDATRARAEARGVALEELSDRTRVLGDRPKLERVLINLISNAVKYGPSGSAVVVRAAPVDGYCRFEVEDRGPGIPEAHQPRIFQRFARAGGEKDPGGTGLGLALARAIVERHGGVIGFESRPGLTRFWFTVPRDPETQA